MIPCVGTIRREHTGCSGNRRRRLGEAQSLPEGSLPEGLRSMLRRDETDAMPGGLGIDLVALSVTMKDRSQLMHVRHR